MLRTTVIIDYQNVHLVGRAVFEPSKAPHECLIHPLHFANQIIHARNANQRDGESKAVLTQVFVYRGLPSAVHDPDAYARNMAQQTEWEKDPRVKVKMRPLTYDYQRDADGRKATDATGKEITTGKREKGIDVLCALAMVREAREPDVDVVLLASQDSDLRPALDEALDLNLAKVETASWYSAKAYHRSREIRPTDKNRRIWNTRLNAQAFAAARDQQQYL
jgi:uncharacterized LabA/DUF88 family protein